MPLLIDTDRMSGCFSCSTWKKTLQRPEVGISLKFKCSPFPLLHGSFTNPTFFVGVLDLLISRIFEACVFHLLNLFGYLPHPIMKSIVPYRSLCSIYIYIYTLEFDGVLLFWQFNLLRMKHYIIWDSLVIFPSFWTEQAVPSHLQL